MQINPKFMITELNLMYQSYICDVITKGHVILEGK